MNPSKAQRVLLYRLGSLGDTIMALPALHLIERTFSSAQRVMLTNLPEQAKAPPVAAVLEGSGLVDGYIHYPVGSRKLSELSRIWWRIRRFRPDYLIYLTVPRGEAVVRRDAKFFRLCGASRIIGLPLGDLAENRFDAATSLWEQEASRLVRCLRELGTIDLEDAGSWDLRLSGQERRKAKEALEDLHGAPFVACGTGTKRQATDWGTENWHALFRRLSAELPGYALLLVGSREDAETSDQAARGWTGRVLNLCGKLKPRETAAVLGHAELFLGPDSGPKFLAAVEGVPCATVFSARDNPGIWNPPGKIHSNVYHAVECQNCGLDTCIVEKKKCILSVSVDEMLAAALAAWRRGSKSGRAGVTLRP